MSVSCQNDVMRNEHWRSVMSRRARDKQQTRNDRQAITADGLSAERQAGSGVLCGRLIIQSVGAAFSPGVAGAAILKRC